MNDTQLLESFANGSETAFRTLVERHLPLVHGTARRMTGDSALAEDVAQTVFLLLARKAQGLGKSTILSGWLYRTTRFVAQRALVSEQRRRRREEQAVHMHHEPEPNALWEHITPHLDDALGHLGETDRNALILRFFNQKPMREVGVALGVSEEAAKKRVARGLEKLRMLLQRRGKEISLAVLVAGLSREGAEAASSVLVSKIASAAKVSAAGSAAVGSALLTEVVSALLWAKIRTATLGAMALITVAFVAPTLFQSSQSGAAVASDARPKKAVAQRTGRPNSVFRSADGAPDGMTTNSLHMLEVTVLDDKTDQPIQGAKVTHSLTFRITKNVQETKSWLTDSNGVVQVPVPIILGTVAERMQQFSVWADAEQYAPRSAMWICTTGNVCQTLSDKRTIRLHRGISISGRVIDDSGHPIEGATVSGRGSNYRGFTISYTGGKLSSPPEIRVDDVSEFSSKGVTTDAAGRFEFANFPPDLKAAFIEVVSPEGVHMKYTTAEGKRLSADETVEVSFSALKSGTAEFVIPRGITVEGVVVNMEGHPIEGAQVLEATQWGNLKVQSTNTTDSTGHFRLLNRQTRESIFGASAPGYAKTSIIANIHAGMQPLRIVLSKEQALRGRVIDRAGNPVAGATVDVADYLNTGNAFDWKGEADSAGRFMWPDAPAMNLSYFVGDKSGTYRIVNLAPSTNEHVIVLGGDQKSIRVTGSVVDAITKAPVSKFQVKISYSATGGVPDEPVETFDEYEGAFEKELSHTNLHLGWVDHCALQIEADGYEPAVSRTFSFNEGDQRFEFALQPGGVVRGIVRTPDGDPAADAHIGLAKLNDTVFSSHPGRLEPSTSLRIRSDKNGRFKFQKSALANSIVVFHEAGWFSAGLETGTTNLNVALQSWGRVEGTLQNGGRPVVGEKITLNPLVWDFSNPINIHYTATTGKDGAFVFEKVPALEYRVSVTPDRLRKPDTTTITTLDTPVTVVAGETASVSLGTTGVRVTARLNAPGVKIRSWTKAIAILRRDIFVPPDPGRSLFVSNESHRVARIAYAHDPAIIAAHRETRNFGGIIDDNGAVTFENIPSGRYILEVDLYKAPEVASKLPDKPTVRRSTARDNDPVARVRLPITIDSSDPTTTVDFGTVELE